jgi:hypothetical protein
MLSRPTKGPRGQKSKDLLDRASRLMATELNGKSRSREGLSRQSLAPSVAPLRLCVSRESAVLAARSNREAEQSDVNYSVDCTGDAACFSEAAVTQS